MSAIDTAIRVINWTVIDDESENLPNGDILSFEGLINPTIDVKEGLKEVYRITNAKIRFGNPPLNIKSDISYDSVLIAAAIGIKEEISMASEVLKIVPRSKYPVDWVVRHGLIGSAIKFLPKKTLDYYLAKSPVTQLFYRPVKSREEEIINIAMQLIEYPSERLSLLLHISELSNAVDVINWRYNLLNRMCRGLKKHKDFVLDVYETMMIYFEKEVLNQVKESDLVFKKSNDENSINKAFAVANFWSPLYFLERENIDELRKRKYLEYSYRECINLFKVSLKMKGGRIN